MSCLIRFLYAAWDCSAWVRTYALFLEERLECFRVLKYDIESERLVKSSATEPKVCALPYYIHIQIFQKKKLIFMFRIPLTFSFDSPIAELDPWLMMICWSSYRHCNNSYFVSLVVRYELMEWKHFIVSHVISRHWNLR